ncbi:MAG: hypothetical protein Q9220_002086 [cf. Caloplaca sp. 1 TL-2023]
MARLTILNDSDDELPNLSAILRGLSPKQRSSGSANGAERTPRQQSSTQKRVEKKQRLLKVTHVNALLLPIAEQGFSYDGNHDQPNSKIGSSPRQRLSNPRKQLLYHSESNVSSDVEHASSDHLSDFIVPDSDSEDSDQDFAKKSSFLPTRNFPNKEVDRVSFDAFPPRRKKVKDLQSHHVSAQTGISRIVSSAVNSDGEERRICSIPHNAPQKAENEEKDSLHEPFSPPHFQSPSKSPAVCHQATPPTSPTKSKLLSPSKKYRVPPSRHRPSIDAFWSSEVINEWNDRHSPEKTPTSRQPRTLSTFDEDAEEYLSPCDTQQRSPAKSPAKKDKQAAEKRKAFNEKKFDLAASFLDELDQTITGGKITELAASTGGVKLVWSKKLQSTAGRANWKREVIRSKDTDKDPSIAKSRHHATIELAEKVIDDEDRLINVIAHEYCHLLNFMISHVKDNPHGKEFKNWAQKCSTAFAHRGVHVTTKHSYKIAYKYIWACDQCRIEYKRHSKSIDPAKHSCGKCKGKLVQMKPVPRGEGRGMSEYQRFVKERYSKAKKESPSKSMGEIMAVLGREFRASKQAAQGDSVSTDSVGGSGRDGLRDDVDLDSLVSRLEDVDLGSRQSADT